jgi:hypothetical protein
MLGRGTRPTRTGDARHKDLTPPADALDHGSVNLHCHRSLQHFDGEEEFAPIFLAEQDPLQTSQRTGRNPDTIATSEEGVRLCLDGTVDHPPKRLYLRLGYACRLSAESHHRVNARSGKNWEPMDKRALEEHITREERERNTLDAVFPLMSAGIEGKESFQPFPRQDMMNTLLVLMASIKRVPSIAGVQICH